MSTSSNEENVGDRFSTVCPPSAALGLQYILIDLPTPVSGRAGIPPSWL